MSTWLDKPDADGLWWRQDGEEEPFLVAVEGKEFVFVLIGKRPMIHGTTTWDTETDRGKWQRCELTKPEPYKPPVPPKVEQCVGTGVSGESRFLTFIVGACIITTLDGVCLGSFSSDWVRANYTDIKPLESPP